MKKTMFVAGLLAVSSVAAFAASVKTSKPVALTDTQMQAVKGEGYFYVFVWTGTSYVIGPGSGPCSFDGYIYVGGPLDGQGKTS